MKYIASVLFVISMSRDCCLSGTESGLVTNVIITAVTVMTLLLKRPVSGSNLGTSFL